MICTTNNLYKIRLDDYDFVHHSSYFYLILNEIGQCTDLIKMSFYLKLTPVDYLAGNTPDQYLKGLMK